MVQNVDASVHTPSEAGSLRASGRSWSRLSSPGALCLVASAAAFRTAPTVASRAGRVNVATSRPMVMAEAGGFVPDMQRRTIMNLLLAGAVGVPGLSMVGGYALFFLPPSSGGGGGTVAKTELGDDISISAWKGSHAALAILEEQGDKIVLTNWAETDFRTGLKPWWN